MKPIIKAENIEKVFQIGSIHSYRTLREGILEAIKFKKETKKYIKALDNINFEIFPGEKIGIIGHNGAGKSTLLKILSRITPPTKGKAVIRGKVASLLEVGTGFHGELTGRENIFFNGAILGMKRNEIKRKLDEIVAFADVDKFLDTPVKHYSSGMLLRLAFAVSSHLDADILLVDEVLAVGDAEFQKKCLGKMNEVSKGGRTILFVSHNLGAIDLICSRSILLQNGKIVDFGSTQSVINKYFSLISKENFHRSFDFKEENESFFLSVELLNQNNEYKNEFFFDEKIIVNISIQINEIYENQQLAVVLANNYNPKLSVFFKSISSFKKGKNQVQLILPNKLIAPGNYFFHFYIYRPNYKIIDKIEYACNFQIIDNGVPNSYLYGGEYGVFITEAEWKLI